MKTTFLAALLLLLLIQVKNSANKDLKFTYGDILGFQRELSCGNKKFEFMHFGIYIDKLRFEEYGQKEGDDLFHITGPIKENKIIKKLSDCVFGKVSEEGRTTVTVSNYLDVLAKNLKKVRLGTEEVITERILCKVHNCQHWSPFHDNCEHLATYIRYGVPISLQIGQSKEGKCHNKRHGFTKEEEQEILDILKSIYDGTENAMAEYYSCIETEFASEAEFVEARGHSTYDNVEQGEAQRRTSTYDNVEQGEAQRRTSIYDNV